MQSVRRYFSYFILLVLIFMTLGIWGAVFAYTPSGVLTVAVMNVGQGDSIFIESPTGVQVVIDGGPDNSILSELPKLMPLSDRSLDLVVETHPDADHITGFVDLLKRYSVGVFIEPGIPKVTMTDDSVEAEVEQKNIPRFIARRGDSVDLGGGAVLKVLFPDFDAATIPENKDNDGGIVLELIYGSSTALFMADVSSAVEDHLLAAYPNDLDIDLLKVGHHGSRTSTDNAFLDRATPQVAVISVGAHNKYGHPTRDTLGRLAQHKIKTLRTDEEGTIVFKSNGREFTRSRSLLPL
jgi:competence protein ComEC